MLGGAIVLFSPELDELKTEIMKNILRESEDFFEPPEDLEVLRRTVEIASEFFIFLKSTDGLPDLKDADYIAGTIRSGIDEFYTMEQWGRILTGLELRRGFTQNLPSTLSEMKKLYDDIFEQLIHCTSSAKISGCYYRLCR
jgi:hypothetical protein